MSKKVKLRGSKKKKKGKKYHGKVKCYNLPNPFPYLLFFYLFTYKKKVLQFKFSCRRKHRTGWFAAAEWQFWPHFRRHAYIKTHNVLRSNSINEVKLNMMNS